MSGEGATIEEQPERPSRVRGFAELHRDVWRSVRRAPWVFLVVPAVLWFPSDLVLETVLERMNLEFWKELRFTFRYERIADLILGTFISTVELVVLARIARGEKLDAVAIVASPPT